MRASSVVAGLILVLGMIPLCSYVGAQLLQRVALANSLASTEWATIVVEAIPHTRRCRPAVLLSHWTIGAEPEDLLAASQTDFVRKVATLCITKVVPLCQKGSRWGILALCKGWLLGVLPAFCLCFCTLWAASLPADATINFCAPLVATGMTEPTTGPMASCHHAVRRTIICIIVPLSCHQGVLGSQRVVLADLVAAALRAASAKASETHSCLPAVQVAVGALITYPPNFPAILGCDVNGAQVSITSMVPLALKSWIKAADTRAILLFTCMLTLFGETAHLKMPGLRSACVQASFTPYSWQPFAVQVISTEADAQANAAINSHFLPGTLCLSEHTLSSRGRKNRCNVLCSCFSGQLVYVK